MGSGPVRLLSQTRPIPRSPDGDKNHLRVHSCLSSGASEVRKSNTLQSLITLLASQSSAELHLRFQSTLYTNRYIQEVVPSRLHFKYKRILLAWEFAEKHLFRFLENYSLQCIGPSTLKLWLINRSALLRLIQWLFLSLNYHSKVHIGKDKKKSRNIWIFWSSFRW